MAIPILLRYEKTIWSWTLLGNTRVGAEVRRDMFPEVVSMKTVSEGKTTSPPQTIFQFNYRNGLTATWALN
jgi:hypothetical protein